MSGALAAQAPATPFQLTLRNPALHRFLINVGLITLNPTTTWPLNVFLQPGTPADRALPIDYFAGYFQGGATANNYASAVVSKIERRKIQFPGSILQHKSLLAHVHSSLAHFEEFEDADIKLVLERNVDKGRGLQAILSQIASGLSLGAFNFRPSDTIRLFNQVTDERHATTLETIYFMDHNGSNDGILHLYELVLLLLCTRRSLGAYNACGHNCYFFCSAIMLAAQQITGHEIVQRAATADNVQNAEGRSRLPIHRGAQAGFCHGIVVFRNPTAGFLDNEIITPYQEMRRWFTDKVQDRE